MTIEDLQKVLWWMGHPVLTVRGNVGGIAVQLVWESGMTIHSDRHPTLEEAMRRAQALYEDYVVASTERPDGATETPS